MFGLKEISEPNCKKMGQEIISELQDFLPELNVLEARLENISPSKQPLFEPREPSTGGLRKHIAKFITGLNKRRSIFNLSVDKLSTTQGQSTMHEIAQKKATIKAEINKLRDYMSLSRNIPCRKSNHTDILNIYWYSKAELDIAEKISTQLDFFDNEISKLES